MAQIIRQSTEIKVRLGPAMGIADGVTPVTSLTIGAADQAEVLKADGAATVSMGGTLAAVTGCDGYYDYTILTTEADTVGTIEVVLQDASASLPLKWIGQVLAAVAFDTLYAASPTILTPADVGLMYESDIATVTAEDELIMTVAFAVDDSWIGNVVSLFDISTSETYSGKAGVGIWISDVLQATNTLKLSSVFPVTLAVGDIIRIHTAMHPRFTIELYDPPTRTEATADKDEIKAKQLAFTRLMTRSDGFVDIDDAVELTAINADAGAGAGNFDPETDSIEAQADVSTEVRLAELDAANMPAGVDAAVALFTTQLTEAYAADGVAPTPAQALFLIQQMLTEFAYAGTVNTVKKLDGTTTAATMTLDDATNPTSSTRAT